MRTTTRFDERATFARRFAVTAAAASLVAVCLLLGFARSAAAEPSIDDKRARAEAILAQVQELDAEVGAAAERYNGANYRLTTLADRLRVAKADLARSRVLLRSARSRASDRLVQLYVEGESGGALDLILGAETLADVIDRVDTADRVAAQDARLVEDVQALGRRTEKRRVQISVSHRRQSVLVGKLASERAAIERSLVARKSLLGSIQAEVRRLEDQERVRQAELRRRAAAELERQRTLAVAQASRLQPSASRLASPDPPPPVADPTETDSPAAEPEPTPSSPPPAPPADAGKGAQAVSIAMRYLGIPYRWGGASPSSGFDCSGLTMYVFAQIGVSLPHYAAAQFGLGRAVSKSELQPGDLVFFRGLGHMGMYIGGGNMIHAPRTGDVVKISSLSEGYYVSNWVGARRVL